MTSIGRSVGQITIGNRSQWAYADEFRDLGVRVSDEAAAAIRNMALAPVVRRLDLVEVSICDLMGIDDPARRAEHVALDDILKRADAAGLDPVGEEGEVAMLYASLAGKIEYDNALTVDVTSKHNYFISDHGGVLSLEVADARPDWFRFYHKLMFNRRVPSL